MCGIIGYVGGKQAAPILLEGLKKLEYRGYDSSGVAVIEDHRIKVKKSRGRLDALCTITNNGKNMTGTLGIGHTRWATHGEPSYENSHPHLSKSGRFAVVHNGIIENYVALKEKLINKGINFVSQTDTEVIAHLFEYYYNGNCVSTLAKVIQKLEGSYAICILSEENPDQFLAVKKSSPMIVGLGSDENFVSSDVTAILNHTREVYYLEDNEIVVLSKTNVSVYNTDLEQIKKEPITIDWDVDAAEKGGYEHFMMKEIQEQPKAIADTINPRIKKGEIVLDINFLDKERINTLNKIFIVGCGTAYHVGVAGKYIIEKLCKIPVEAVVASEFRYSDPIISDKDLVILISQSGETADTIAALKEAKSKKARTLAIVNVVGSAIAKEADDVIYTWAGPEIAVASTKAYSTQLCITYMIAIYMAYVSDRISRSEYDKYIGQLMNLPQMVGDMINKKEKVQFLASRFYNCHSVFFIGRNIDYAVSLEGSLKLKEISYIHSEAYAAGEMKHGTISLIEDGTLVVAVAAYDQLYDKTVSNIREVKARGADVFMITGYRDDDEASDYVLHVPEVDSIFMPSLTVVPLQLFAYYVASFKGCDIDKPRNLAKSVTVE